MKKFVFFLVFLMFLGLGIREAKAQGFYVKFIDSDNSGSVDFLLWASNYEGKTYYLGVAPVGSYTPSSPSLTIPGGTVITSSKPVVLPGYNATVVSLPVSSGGSVIYDVYLTDGVNTYWTSKGDASGIVGINTLFGNFIEINWSNSGNLVDTYAANFTISGDTFTVVPVPLPSNLWFLAGGLLLLGAFGIARKRFSLN